MCLQCVEDGTLTPEEYQALKTEVDELVSDFTNNLIRLSSCGPMQMSTVLMIYCGLAKFNHVNKKQATEAVWLEFDTVGLTLVDKEEKKH